jgi:hypothetical protein
MIEEEKIPMCLKIGLKGAIYSVNLANLMYAQLTGMYFQN